MSNKPDNAPEACPGTESQAAGQSSACQGCPNQKICASGQPRQPDPAIQEVKWRMASVKHKIIVLSGKGGVGKSSVTTMLAHGLALNTKIQVGVLDIDICGPSLPKMLGVEGEQVHQSGSGWSPVFVEDNLSLMSVAFLLESEDDAVIWRGPRKNGLIKQFLKDVDWGELDYLIMDTPPGTSDEHLSLIQYLAQTKVDGVVLVTTPQEVALLDVRKEIDFCRKVKLPIIGVVENMSGFVCGNCQHESFIFPATTGGAQKLCTDLDLTFLGKLPMDPRIGRCCDEGKCYLTEHSESAGAKAYHHLIKGVIDYCDKRDSVSEEVIR